jgi:hypothetical protein
MLRTNGKPQYPDPGSPARGRGNPERGIHEPRPRMGWAVGRLLVFCLLNAESYNYATNHWDITLGKL